MSQPAEPGAAASRPDSGGPAAGGGAPAGKAVVVGVDGSDASRAAIALAAREARYRGAPLIAVQAYSGERTLGAPAARPLSTLRTAGMVRSPRSTFWQNPMSTSRTRDTSTEGGWPASAASSSMSRSSK